MKYIKPFLKSILFIFLLLISFTSIWATFTSAPWVPSRKKDFERIKKLLKMKKGDNVYDLGCGDGRLCLYLARNSSAKIVGVEFSFFYYLVAKCKSLFSNYSDAVNIQWGNFYKKNIQKANKVFLYLTSKTSTKLSQKLFKELKEGSKVIAYNYPIHGWHYDSKDQPNAHDVPIYIYTINKNTQRAVMEGWA